MKHKINFNKNHTYMPKYFCIYNHKIQALKTVGFIKTYKKHRLFLSPTM